MSASIQSKKRRSIPSTHLIRSSVHSALFAALAAASVAAHAQQAPAGDAQPLQEVIVTGSLIKRPDAETAEAVTVVSTESLKAQGVTTVEQALERITSNQSAVTTATATTYWSGGGSFASLRGLGQSKTLVLLDGQRLANNVVYGNGIDLNTIPFAAIDHIEVLREGASSLYGSDAIGGVINFITKKNYEKGEVDINFSHPEHPGGASGNAEITFGHGNLATDGYNFLITGNYTKQQRLTAGERPFSATGVNVAKGLYNTNGPEGPWPGAYFDDNDNLYQVGYPGCAGNPHLSTINGACEYLYSGAVDTIARSELWSTMAQFTKALPGNNTLSIQYFFSHAQVTTWGGPMEYFATQDPSSPFYPTAAESSLIEGTAGAAPVLGGPLSIGWTDPGNNRYNGSTNTEQRALVTFAGSNGGWDYEADFNYSRNHNVITVSGYPDLNLIAPGGVVSNLINPYGPQTAAGQAYINSTYEPGALAAGSLPYYSLNGHANHELGDAFNAGRPAQIAIGANYQYQSIDYNPTALATTLYTSTFYPPQAISGHQSEEAIYAELNVPVTKAFEFTISDRQDRYSDFGTTNNAKLSARYQPFDFLTFRAAASTGFRAPSLVDLYSPQVLGATNQMIGPGCASGNYTAVFSQLNCASQGMALSGGNTNLEPETSQNFDIGFIVAPIANLGITLDYYRINIKNEIQALSGSTIYANQTNLPNLYVLNNAGTLSTANAAAVDCANGPSTPTCGYIVQTTTNTGGIDTGGFDLSANYLIRTGFGKFKVAFDGTLITTYQLQAYKGADFVNLVGQWNDGFAPEIRWQHQISLDWEYGQFGAGVDNHFLSRYTDKYPDANGNGLTVPSYSIFGTYVSYKPVEPLTLLFGIKNVLDKDPGFSNQNVDWQAGYNPILNDPTGRTFYVRIKYEIL